MGDDEEVITDGTHEEGQGQRQERRALLTVEGLEPRPRIALGPRPVLAANKLPAAVEANLDRLMKPGGRVVAESDGRAYRIADLSTHGGRVRHLGTLEREIPKVKGKAARRADKQRRRLERERALRRINAILDEE